MRRHRRFPVVLLAVASACASATSTVNTNAADPAAATSGDRLSDAGQARQALNRLTFGARAADVATIERMGVRAWVDWQLHPERIDDGVADSVLDLLDITHKNAFELYADHPQPNE